jgi:hypothetical protein
LNQGRLPQIGGSQKRQPSLRIAHGYSHQPHTEQLPRQTRPPQAARFSLWRISLIVVPMIAAAVSTSLLAYFLLSGQQPHPPAQLQTVEQQQAQPPSAQLDQLELQRAQPPSQQESQQLAQNEQQPSEPQQAKPEPQPPAGPPPTVPNDAVLLTLIRSALTALWQANLTGNYSVLRDMGAPSFQEANSVEKLAQVFTGLRQSNLDLSAILLIQPTLYQKAAITPRGNLRIRGFFPAKPELLNFDLIFEPAQGGRWRIYGIFAEKAPWPQQPAPQAAAPAPASEAPKPDAQASGAAAKKPTTKPAVDIRDQVDTLETAPSPPPPETPHQNSTWNPFSR